MSAAYTQPGGLLWTSTGVMQGAGHLVVDLLAVFPRGLLLGETGL